MKTGVVILTYKRPASLERCLEALFADIAGRDDFGVLVIDNAAEPEVKGIAGKFGAGYIADTKRSKGYLRNLGWKRLDADIIAYIDDDAEAHKGYAQSIQELFGDQEVAAATGPCIVKGRQFMLRMHELAGQNRLISFLFGLYDRLVCENRLLGIGRFFANGAYSIGGALEESARQPAPLEIEIMSSCNMAIRRSALEAVAGFDEKFIYNHEDGDLSLRMRQAGYKLFFDPRMAVAHNVHPAKNTRGSAFFFGRDFGRFYAKHAKITSVKIFLGLAMNILLLNFYWLGQMLRSGRPEPLLGITGLFEGWQLGGDKR